jgi:hypothetical protein
VDQPARGDVLRRNLRIGTGTDTYSRVSPPETLPNEPSVPAYGQTILRSCTLVVLEYNIIIIIVV